MATVTYEARAVLAGAYRGKDIGSRSLLIHAVELHGDQEVRSLCRVKLSSLCDVREEAVTCPDCVKRLAAKSEAPYRGTGR